MTSKIITSYVPPPLPFEVKLDKISFHRLGVQNLSITTTTTIIIMKASFQNLIKPTPEKCTHTPVPKLSHTALGDSQNS